VALVGLVLSLTMLASTGPTAGAAAVTPKQIGVIPKPFIDGHASLYAWGAATMPDGSVAIGDIWNRRVVHYDDSGNFLGVLFVLPNGENPYGLAVDPNNGIVYVGASSCCTIERWVPNPITHVYSMVGSIVNSSFKYPSRVTVAADSSVYIADMIVAKIFVYGASGNFKFSFGSKGSAPGQFTQPRALAFDTSSPPRLYVLDAYNYRVEVFTAAGGYLFSFGSFGTNPGQFAGSNTRGLAVDTVNKWIYIVDITDNMVHKFDLNGNWLLDMAGTGGHSQTTCCSTPLGKFSDGGREATVDGNGNLWVGDMSNFRAQVFSPSGQALFAVPNPAQNPAIGGFNYPEGVAVDQSGNVIVSDSRNFRLEKFDPTQHVLWTLGVRGRWSGYSLNYARGLAADPRDGSIVLADNFSSLIKKYNSNGVFQWQAGGQGSAPGQVNHPSNIAIGADGSVYVADSWNKRITVYNSNGSYQRTINSSSGFTFKDPRGITIDPANGDLYVADYSARSVFHLTNSGGWVATIGSNANLGYVLTDPSDVEVDSTNIYVSDSFANQVDIYNKSTRVFVGAIGTSGTKVSGPDGLAIRNGVLYVSELFTNKISEWCVSGTC
jgi:DNA-binding beta-propeller fold protein YncE